MRRLRLGRDVTGDRTAEHGLSPIGYDDEGVAAQRWDIVKDGKPADACPGTNASGALELATGGSWGGTWFGGKVEEGKFKGLGYAVETILGETWTFSSGSFWNFWVDNKAQEPVRRGAMQTEVDPIVTGLDRREDEVTHLDKQVLRGLGESHKG